MGKEIAEVFCLFGLYFLTVVELTLLEFRVDQHFRKADPRQLFGADIHSMGLASGNHIPVYALLVRSTVTGKRVINALYD